MFSFEAVVCGVISWTMLLTHVLFGCQRTPPAPKSKSLMSGKSTKSGHEQVTFPMAKTTQKTAGKSTEKSAEKPAKRTHSAEAKAKKSLKVERTVEIKMPDDIAKSHEFKDAEDEIQKTKEEVDANDAKSKTITPCMVPTKA